MEEKKALERLEAEMREAWRNTPESGIPEGWRESVMREISATRHNNVLWKCAVIAACAACACALIVPARALSIDDELIRLIMQDPTGILRNLPIGF